MPHVNIEIKARYSDPDRIRRWLRDNNADFRGVDHQTDTYYKIPHGRLKLRQGSIENSLIFYNRPNQAGPKQADVSLYRTVPDSSLGEVLKNALNVLIVINKQREIYFLDNVKFHIDQVEQLGGFVEIEAIDEHGTIGIDKLRAQCDSYMRQFDIRPEDLMTHSYSDMLLLRQKKFHSLNDERSR